MLYNMNQMFVYCIQCQRHCATMLSKKVHIVANITTMKSFPASWIRPAPSAAAAAAAAIQLMQACRQSQKPSRDLTRAMD